MSPGPLRPLLLMFLSANLFATMNLFAKMAADGAHWSLVASTRAFVGAMVAFTFARARGLGLRPNYPRSMWLRSVLGTLSLLATFFALSRHDMPLSDTVTLLSLSPLCTALLAPFFLDEPRERAVTFAAVLGACGVVLIVRPAFLFGHAASANAPAALTAAAAVTAALASGLAMIALRHVGQRENAETISLHFSLTAGTTLLLVSLVLSHAWPTPRACAYMLIAGALGGTAQIAMTTAYANANAGRVAPINYAAVITSTLLGAAVLRQYPTVPQVCGMALIIVAGLWLARG